MQKITSTLAISILVIVSWANCLTADSSGTDTKQKWLTDMEQAKQLAAAEGKSILMDFTGSDWCSWCIKLSDEVFSKPEFQSWAEENLILVELDFPSDESKIPQHVRKHHEKWLNELQVEGFPTVVLADDQGRPFAQTGYKAGGSVTYIEHLNQLLHIRSLRDKAFDLAAKANEEDEARYLDDALSTMEPKLAGLHYSDELEKIKTQGNDALREKYENLAANVQGGAESVGMNREDWMADPFGFIGNDMQSASDELHAVKTEPPVKEYHPRIERRLARLIELMEKT